ncbi:MAG: glycosyltransferase [Muribaculaceae bacterium]|jgi:Glycosyltransferases involved in cell wall biogenesis
MISVCMATYNGGKYLKKQLDSILFQLNDDDEIIISDDGSIDNTVEIINGFNDKRIKLLRHQKNKINHQNAAHIYTTKNFENALNHANGDLIFLCDQDDRWHPDRVKIMTNYLREYDCVMCNFNLMDEKDKIYQNQYFPNSPISKSLFVNLIRMPFYGSAMAFRKQLLSRILPFPNDLPVHDNWIGLISQKYGKTYFITKSLHDYRRHNNSVSNAASGISSNSLSYRLKYRLAILISYLKR